MPDTMRTTLPARRPARTNMLSIRLTPAERARIEALAKQLRLPASHMARHFILQATRHYQMSIQEKSVET